MKRCLTALAASLALAFAAGAEVASASGGIAPPLPVASQSNSSDQGQIQVVPIAPQVNVQNVNIATGNVDQGDANNANTGQASQQENTQAPPRMDAAGPAAAVTPGPAPAPTGAQRNDSDQSQIQVVPIAPQVNVQNVNVATHGDVKQGDANNANTGQANQQENTSKSSSRPTTRCGTCSPHSSGGSQRNDSDQSQIQVVPIAPQVNVQNVNVATYGDVKQGDANNANTGQANQQENTSKSSSRPTTRCGTCSPHSSGGSQRNDSDQSQIQVVPIAPQVNVQNVNIATHGDVKQGDANNANTGQANQQENTSKGASAPAYSRPGSWKPSSGSYQPSCGCGPKPTGGQSNRSKQEQIQIVPIAPQVNVQNKNFFTFGDVKQGDVNNANTGQANQQKNRSSGGHQPPTCRSTCGPPPRPCECQPEPKPCECQHEPRPCECQPEPRPCGCQPEPRPCECQPAPRPAHCGCGSRPSGQSNWSRRQIQFIPIAPQLSVQNLNLFTFGDVKQGDANNANTGQANQQKNVRGGGDLRPPVGPPVPARLASNPRRERSTSGGPLSLHHTSPGRVTAASAESAH